MRHQPEKFVKLAASAEEDSSPSAIRKIAPYAVGAAGLGAGLLGAGKAVSAARALEAAKDNFSKQRRVGAAMFGAAGLGSLGAMLGGATLIRGARADAARALHGAKTWQARATEAAARAEKESARADSIKQHLSAAMKGRHPDLDHAKMQAEAQMKKQSHVDVYRKYASIARQNEGLLKVAHASTNSLAGSFASEMEKISSAATAEDGPPLVTKGEMLGGAALLAGGAGAGLGYHKYLKSQAAQKAIAEAADAARATKAARLAALGGLAGSALMGLAGAAFSPVKKRVHAAAEGLGESALGSMGFKAPPKKVRYKKDDVPFPRLRPEGRKKPTLYDAKGNPIP